MNNVLYSYTQRLTISIIYTVFFRHLVTTTFFFCINEVCIYV